jgi:hypothetical protein
MKNKWKLVRESDKLTKKSQGVGWIEWDENDKFKEMHENIDIGRSLIMSPFNKYFTWQTTPVTEILEQTENYIAFKTKNSTYKLSKL